MFQPVGEPSQFAIFCPSHKPDKRFSRWSINANPYPFNVIINCGTILDVDIIVNSTVHTTKSNQLAQIPLNS